MCVELGVEANCSSVRIWSMVAVSAVFLQTLVGGTVGLLKTLGGWNWRSCLTVGICVLLNRAMSVENLSIKWISFGLLRSSRLSSWEELVNGFYLGFFTIFCLWNIFGPSQVGAEIPFLRFLQLESDGWPGLLIFGGVSMVTLVLFCGRYAPIPCVRRFKREKQQRRLQDVQFTEREDLTEGRQVCLIDHNITLVVRAKLDSSNYIDSAGLVGEIPTELVGPDNPFTGKLPDFIGNWTKLTSLSTLGPASYYVEDSTRWAVNNVVLFYQNARYIQNTLGQTRGTLDPELFQTARLSPGSLRYYSLGLENGKYNVNLQFAETGFDDESSRTWQSLGRRVFDIYIQPFPNFPGKSSDKGPQHKKRGWWGHKQSRSKIKFKYLKTSLIFISFGLERELAAYLYKVTMDLQLSELHLRRKPSSSNEEEELVVIDNRSNAISYAGLRTATELFNPTIKLGEVGFGPVYKGMLSDGREIAVKKLLGTSHQGKSQFVAEVSIISAVQHRNLVKLYGSCIQGENKLLVYEYLRNKSPDQALFGKSSLYLDWLTQYDICLGAARVLAYLHEESNPRIIHRDVKASNILLDIDLYPKISDFGLAKLYDDKKTHISS
ncbi:hypothetical protein IFM89_000887 [Coptis chinensis]|uniref:non-specific serine/threonine protein kinase n=1 Tax=Coptis chinensis TaxID=261450 RepID=A0A835IKS3_9MAGN|nr:hypothetical protein IFM89_000887 [Coptis chinensis]